MELAELNEKILIGAISDALAVADRVQVVDAELGEAAEILLAAAGTQKKDVGEPRDEGGGTGLELGFEDGAGDRGREAIAEIGGMSAQSIAHAGNLILPAVQGLESRKVVVEML